MSITIYMDPFFHYHAPLKGYYYSLDNERSQNFGITTFWDYDTIITGSSLTQNYHTTEFDEMFDTRSIKLPFSGATFKETADIFKRAYDTGHDLKIVFRSFDVNHLVEDSDYVRTDLGEYPEYLYNDIWWDDFPYVVNIDILTDYCIPMIRKRLTHKPGGHTSFNDYMFGEFIPASFAGREALPIDNNTVKFTVGDSEILTDNLEKNVLSIAREHPETTFIFFIPPYNIMWWRDHAVKGELPYVCNVMKRATVLLLECDNIKLYCFAGRTDLTTNLSLYEDEYHYISELNGDILSSIKNNECLLTKENYIKYFDELENYYKNYDYVTLVNNVNTADE